MESRSRQLINGNKKVPRCVAIYNKLFDMIKDGEFSEAERLPTEPELAKYMGVSRTTLRQALEFLQDDGIIKNIWGKGNFIVRSELDRKEGLEVLANPIYNSLEEKIDDIEFEFAIEVSSKYTTKVLKRDTPVVIFADRWYKSKGRVIAYTLSIIPIETISSQGIDLKDKNNLLNYLERTLYKEATSSTINFSFSGAGNISATKYIVSESDRFYLMAETISSNKDYPDVHNKHYIPVEQGRIVINRKK